MPVEIPLTRGFVALVDDEDAEWARRWKWRANGTRWVYAARTESRVDAGQKRRLLLMHRLMLGDPSGVFIDHADGNTLNNCRSNLRLATPSQNTINSRRPAGLAGTLKGVHWDARRSVYYARVRINGRAKYKYSFATPEAAHEAYVQLAKEHFGEFARFE